MVPEHSQTLTVLPDAYAICRLDADASLPDWALRSSFAAVVRTPDEWSVVCRESDIPDGIRAERGWAGLRVDGPLDFALTGILASLATPLAEAGLSIFALSTYDTDHLLVRAETLDAAIAALEATGHTVQRWA